MPSIPAGLYDLGECGTIMVRNGTYYHRVAYPYEGYLYFIKSDIATNQILYLYRTRDGTTLEQVSSVSLTSTISPIALYIVDDIAWCFVRTISYWGYITYDLAAGAWGTLTTYVSTGSTAGWHGGIWYDPGGDLFHAAIYSNLLGSGVHWRTLARSGALGTPELVLATTTTANSKVAVHGGLPYVAVGRMVYVRSGNPPAWNVSLDMGAGYITSDVFVSPLTGELLVAYYYSSGGSYRYGVRAYSGSWQAESNVSTSTWATASFADGADGTRYAYSRNGINYNAYMAAKPPGGSWSETLIYAATADSHPLPNCHATLFPPVRSAPGFVFVTRHPTTANLNGRLWFYTPGTYSLGISYGSWMMTITTGREVT